MAEIRNGLPRLQFRAQNIINLIFGALTQQENTDPVLADKITHWFQQIVAQKHQNGFDDAVELFKSLTRLLGRPMLTVDVSQKYTAHKYLPTQEYSSFNEKHRKIIFLANLALLLIQLVELSSEWPIKSHEEKSLELTNIDLMFPTQFLYPEKFPSAQEASILLELRTQIFVEMFLENLHEGAADEWNSSTKVKEIFKLAGQEKRRLTTKNDSPEEKVTLQRGP